MDLLKANDVAQRLAVSRAWVYEAAKSGRIPSVRIGGEDGPLRFVPEDIDRWLTEARAKWSPGARERGSGRDVEAPESGSQIGSRRRFERKTPVAQQQQSLL